MNCLLRKAIMVILKNRKHLFFVALVFLMTTVLSSIGCGKSAETNKNNDYISYISFSPDGKRIIFDRQKGKGPYLVNVYDLETGMLSAYQSPSDERWSMARYSFDGKYIVLCIYNLNGISLQFDKIQIAIMDPEGKNMRKITDSEGPKVLPSFSHSSEKIIFNKASKIRESGKTPAADFDIYEVDIRTRKETRLTWFKFFAMDPPYFYPDDETIIFGAYAKPLMYPDIDENDHKANWERQRFLVEKDKKRGRILPNNDIYVIKKGAVVLPNPFVCDIDGITDPLISRDGKHIYFCGTARKPDGIYAEGHQFYQYSVDGKHRRLTYITPPSNIYSAALSPDEQYLAIVTGANESRIIKLCNIKDGTSRTINLPDQPSSIINLNPN